MQTCRDPGGCSRLWWPPASFHRELQSTLLFFHSAEMDESRHHHPTSIQASAKSAPFTFCNDTLCTLPFTFCNYILHIIISLGYFWYPSLSGLSSRLEMQSVRQSILKPVLHLYFLIQLQHRNVIPPWAPSTRSSWLSAFQIVSIGAFKV